jgi:retron-type reverse transcriptase
VSTIFTLEKLYEAYQQCQQGKKNTINALEFELNREKNLLELLTDLKTRKYQIARHIYFIVTSPTPREIFAADFRDRVVHHLLCNEIQSLFERSFVEQSYANRQGKGTHKAVAKLQELLQETKRVTRAEVYYLKLDIENFFRSIDQTKLFSLIEQTIRRVDANTDTNQGNGTFENAGVGDRKFEYKRESAGEAKPSQTKWQEEILWLCRKIIFHDPTKNYIYRGDKAKQKLIPLYKSLFHGEVGKGLPIGNLTSQFFANVYLNQLDHYLTDTLQVKAFVRYVDDFVIVSVDRKKLRSYQQRINHFLEQELSLRLHPRKTELQAGQKGIDFLGYVIRPNYRLVRQKVVGRFKVAINTFKQTAKREQWPVATSEDSDVSALQQKFKHVVSSYHGHFSHAASYRLSVALKKHYEHLLGAQNHLG